VTYAIEVLHDLQANFAMSIRDDSHHHRRSLFVAKIHRLLNERGAPGIHRFQVGQVSEQPKARLQFSESISHLLDTFLGLFRQHQSAVTNHEQISWLIDFEMNHSFKRLYFFKRSRSRSCGNASTR